MFHSHTLGLSCPSRPCLQVRDDCPGPLEKWYRHISKGAWPFSTRDHGWPISDCSSEGLKVSLCKMPLTIFWIATTCGLHFIRPVGPSAPQPFSLQREICLELAAVLSPSAI